MCTGLRGRNKGPLLHAGLHLATWGEVDPKADTLAMWLGFPAGALSRVGISRPAEGRHAAAGAARLPAQARRGLAGVWNPPCLVFLGSRSSLPFARAACCSIPCILGRCQYGKMGSLAW